MRIEPAPIVKAAEFISAKLVEAGHKTKRAQALIVGEAPEVWVRYLKRHTSPTETKIEKWFERAKEAGLDLEYTRSAGGVR